MTAASDPVVAEPPESTDDELTDAAVTALTQLLKRDWPDEPEESLHVKSLLVVDYLRLYGVQRTVLLNPTRQVDVLRVAEAVQGTYVDGDPTIPPPERLKAGARLMLNILAGNHDTENET